jgi:hypothetical protein
MWEDRFAVNLLVGSPEQTSILGREAPSSEAGTDEVLVLVWPFGDMSGVGRVFPNPAVVRVRPGPLEKGDLDSEPRLLYVAFRASQLEDSSPAAARFEEGIELLGWEVAPGSEGQTQLRLRWRATRPLSTDYHVFAHLVRDGQVIAQADGVPGDGFYPTSWWRPGDEIVDEHSVAASYDPQRDQIVVGWYELGSMRHLDVIWGEQGELGKDRLTLP